MTTQQPEAAVDQERPKVSTFRPAAFQITQFEVLTAVPAVEEFKATAWVCVEGGTKVADPMFEVYDDVVAGSSLQQSNEQSDDAQLSWATEEGGSSEFDEDADPTVIELKQALREEKDAREALVEEHARQIEELKTSLTEQVRAEAERESEEKLKAIEERYAALVEDINAQMREGLEGIERRAVEFSVRVAKKLVGTIVEINPEYVLEVIKEAIKLTGGATIKAIRVSPQDLEFLKMLSPEKQFKEFDGAWSFQPDDSIRAGCILETSSGEVEYDLDKAWERIKESVTKVR